MVKAFPLSLLAMRSFIPRSCGVNIIAQGLDKGDKWSAGMEPRGVMKQGSRINARITELAQVPRLERGFCRFNSCYGYYG